MSLTDLHRCWPRGFPLQGQPMQGPLFAIGSADEPFGDAFD